MNEDAQVHFDRINGAWMWFVEKGKYQMRGACDTLDKAESKAFEVLGNLPDLGVVHTFYSPGKPVSNPEGTFSEALGNEGFKKALDKTINDPKTQQVLDKLGSDYDADGVAYWDKWDSDFGNP